VTERITETLRLETATPADIGEITALRTAVALDLSARYGTGHWSAAVTENGVLRGVMSSRVFVVRQASEIVATVRLATKKPWAIDVSYFTPSVRALYLTDMAVHPSMQQLGIGRKCLDETKRLGTDWLADAIRLDAYDAPAGAGGFYSRCGYREVGRVTYRNTPLIYFETLL
jgi:ribosomal protein S18 acetylase RimI-like enzyme